MTRRPYSSTQVARAVRMPTEQDAIDVMFDAYQRLHDLGWSDAIYCPKDGRTFDVIEMGSIGIHECVYHGEWPNGCYLIGGEYHSHPVLFRLKPADKADLEKRMNRAAARFHKDWR